MKKLICAAVLLPGMLATPVMAVEITGFTAHSGRRINVLRDALVY